ncbi:MAG: copper homeostasis protein CutC [Bacteroidetes bacterium]|nr:copper homeostasis protein CutC [Bacteroidota bacterium]
MLIEIATTDFETTQLAVKGGADRIELCTGLSEGGITASAGLLKLCRKKFDLPIYPIIRPRSGDFLYNKDEFEIMKHDIRYCRSLGFEGVVLGLLNINGSIDQDRVQRLIELAYPLEVTFHRAFDRCVDSFAALEQLIQLGCERILTSGQQPTAPEGASLIAALQKKADDRIIIMPGSGVHTDSIVELAKQTGCVEFHSSLRSLKDSAMQFIHPSFTNSKESYTNPGIVIEAIQLIKQKLNAL